MSDQAKLCRRIERLHRWLRSRGFWIRHVEYYRDSYLQMLGERGRENEELRAENWRLRDALRDIAKQHLDSEMTEEESDHADYEGAYDSIVKVARAALASTEPEVDNKPPVSCVEIRMSIGAESDEIAIRQMQDYLYEWMDGGPRASCWGGAGSHGSIDVSRRDVTPEQYREELAAWMEKCEP